MACTKNFTPEADFNPEEGFTDYPPYLCPQTMYPDTVPAYQTGYEDMSKKVMERMLLTQYTNSPNLQEYMLAFIEEVNTLTDEIHRVEYGRYIDNASAAQLDVIGVILQQTRNLNIPKVWFGFQGASPVDGFAPEDLPLAGGIFRGEAEQAYTVATPLDDVVYRKVLLCRAFTLNQASFDVNTVYKAIETALGRIPADIRLYENAQHDWVLELDSDSTTTEEVGILRAIQHWFIPMITSLNIRLKLLKKLVNGYSIYDVQIYRTADDDDNGAWRDAATGTSWYNELLNTATRGKSQAFPEVALIVTEVNRLTIYDATRNDLPMWMVFNEPTGWDNGIAHLTSGIPNAFARMREGILYCGEAGNLGLDFIDFKNDSAFTITSSSLWGGDSGTDIEGRNGPVTYQKGSGSTLPTIVSSLMVSVRITSDGSGNNIVYLATEHGLDRILSNYTKSSWTDLGNGVDVISALSIKDDLVTFAVDSSISGKRILVQDATAPLVDCRYYDPVYQHYVGDLDLTWASSTLPYHYGGKSSYRPHLAGDYMGSYRGLTRLFHNESDWGRSMIATITKDFNSGIQHGNIQGAYLSSIDDTTIGVDMTTSLVVNGHFTTNTDGWVSNGGGTLSVDAGRLKVTCGASSYPNASQVISGLTVGKSYKVTADCIDGNVPARADLNWDNFDGNENLTAGEFTFVAKYPSCNIELFALTTIAGEYVYFDNIVLTETNNLVSNSEVNRHITDWSFNTPNTVLTIDQTLGELVVTNGTTYGVAFQAIPTIEGRQYEVITRCASKNYVTGSPALRVGYTQAQNELAQLTFAGVLPWTASTKFTGTGDDVFVSVLSGSNVPGESSNWDFIEMRLVEDDRSSEYNGLAIYGEIDKEPVASGAELMAYSGFSKENYLEQTHNTGLDFGTGDFYVMGWMKVGNDTTTEIVMDRAGASGSSGDWSLQVSPNNKLLWNWPFVVAIYGLKTIPVGEWTFFVAVREGGVGVRLYVNGEIDISVTSAANADVTKSIPMKVGNNQVSTAAFQGGLSLLRIGEGVPSAAQIETIYNEEKGMFEPNAKCTLQGSSNLINAIDYDVYRETVKACSLYNSTTFKGLVVQDTEAEIATSVSTVNGASLTGGTIGAYFEA